MRTLLILLIPAGMFAQEPKPVVLDEATLVNLRDIAFQAAREGDLKTLTEYFKLGRPVNEVNARGDTLLTVAAYSGQAKAVAEILKQPKVEIDKKNRMGLSALTAAAFKGEVEIAKALVKAGADVNLANGSKQTALMFASLSGRTATVEYLLSVGANPAAVDDKGNTALKLARTQGADDVVKLLTATAKKD